MKFPLRALPALLLAALAAPLAGATPKPNVLLVCVDDLKPLLGSYGAPLVQSPHIDRFAARAVRFDRAYCNQAVCAPSRNALMTGLRPQTLGIYDLGTFFRHAAPEAVTLAQAFQKAGYRTESLGKIFHTGHGNRDDAASWSVPSWRPRAAVYARAESTAGAPKTKIGPTGLAFESADVPDSTYGDGLLADEAIRRLRAAKAKAGEPFFLAVGFIRPHLPFVAPKKYWDLYDPAAFKLAEPQTPPRGAPDYAPQFGTELRPYPGIPREGTLPEPLQRTLIHGYHAAVSYMDAQLGRVLAELEALDLSRNTIVVLWGDHGWHLGDHGIWCKHTNYEQAARIPLLVAAPGVKPGAATSALVETVDLYPTLCELAGLPAPAGLDGRSFAAALRNPAAAARDHVVHVYPRGRLLGRAIRTERHRLVEWKPAGAAGAPAEFELYDYEADPLETENLAAAQPEVLARLRAVLARHPEARPSIAPAVNRKVD